MQINNNQAFTFLKKKSSFEILGKVLLIIALLYLFILAITLLGHSFKLMGRGFAESIFDVTANPIVGLFIGILATAIIQSSSTSTSIVVGLVGTGVLSIESAVPLLMGANIGTSVTNTMVSLAHVSNKEEFKKAFAGSTVHDFFNICSVIVLLPLEIYFGIISKSAVVVQRFTFGFSGLKFTSPIAAISKPVAKQIAHLVGDIGWLTAIISILLLFIALRYIVKVLKSLVLTRVESFFQRYVFRTPILGFMLGIAITVLVQSSSITTSLIIPLIGAGVINIHQMFPYVLGSNIGTTVTAFLASFAVGSPQAVSIAFSHLLFNVYGISIFWPLKRIPIFLARKLAEYVQKAPIIAIIYIILTFFVLPGVFIFILR